MQNYLDWILAISGGLVIGDLMIGVRGMIRAKTTLWLAQARATLANAGLDDK